MLPFIMPYKIDRRFARTPWVTIGFIVANTLVWLATAAFTEPVADAFGFRLDASGLLYGWITSMFLHDGLMHLGSNMYFLWLFGSYVEDALGWKAWLATYMVGGLAAALAHGFIVMFASPALLDVPLIGASGALSGIMGLFMVRFYKTKMKFALCWPFFPIGKWRTFAWTSLVGIGLYLAQEVGSGLLSLGGSDGVAHWAHVGGMVFGAAIGLVSGLREEADAEYLGDEAMAAAQSGMHEVAAAGFAQLSEKAPADPELLYCKARETLHLGGDPQAVAEDLRQAFASFAKQSQQARLVLALDEIRTDLPRVPLDARTLSTLASAAESYQRPDLASEIFWRIVQEHPERREAERALFRLAHIYLNAGMPNETRDTWLRFRALHPQSEWLPYADARLAAIPQGAG